MPSSITVSTSWNVCLPWKNISYREALGEQVLTSPISSSMPQTVAGCVKWLFGLDYTAFSQMLHCLVSWHVLQKLIPVSHEREIASRLGVCCFDCRGLCSSIAVTWCCRALSQDYEKHAAPLAPCVIASLHALHRLRFTYWRKQTPSVVTHFVLAMEVWWIPGANRTIEWLSPLWSWAFPLTPKYS